MKNLSFPLYHATSSLFVPSIKKFGLGGFNPIKDLQVIELMKEVEIIGKSNLKGVKGWLSLEYSTSLMTSQKITFGGNFQHGETYLTPSLSTAARYADNKYGSEAITQVFEIVDLLEANGIRVPIELNQKYSSLFAIRNNPCKPIVYRLNNLPLKFLSKGERGENLLDQIKKIEEIIREVGEEEMESYVQQINFRVKEPIPWKIVIS